MTIITILGNGESRNNINLNSIETVKIGCNAIIRDHEVDHLVCVDRKMVIEAQSYNFPKIYTRTDWANNFGGVLAVPELPFTGDNKWNDPFHWGSGPYAVLLGCNLAKVVHLVGFDLYSSTNYINNMYKGTVNYNSIDHRAIDPRFWIAQIGGLINHFSFHTFVIHQPITWELPNLWRGENVFVDNSLFGVYN